MIPIDQDFIICFYCNQPVHITKAKDIAGGYNTLSTSQHFQCHNCNYISYLVLYVYDPDFKTKVIQPRAVSVDMIRVNIKNNINVTINLSSRGIILAALASPDKIIHRFDHDFKDKFLFYPMNKLIDKMNNLLAFI